MSDYLLEALRTLKKFKPAPDNGICLNVQIHMGHLLRNCHNQIEKQTHMGTASYSMRRLLQRWPESKDTSGRFPVEGCERGYLQDMMRGTLWQNPRRIALLDWMIKELENDTTGRTS